MDLDKKILRKNMFLISFTIILFLGLQNISIILEGIGYVLGLFMPFILGLCIAFILSVPLGFIENKVFKIVEGKKNSSKKVVQKKGNSRENKGELLKKKSVWDKCRRPIAILLTFCLVIGIIMFLLFLVIPEIGRTIELIRTSLPTYLEHIMIWAQQIASDLNLSVDLLNNMQFNWESLEKTVINFFSKGSISVVNMTLGITTSLVNNVMTLFMGLIFAIYILFHKETLGAQVKKLLYAFLPERAAVKVLEISTLSNQIFSRFVSGQLTEAVIIGVLCFIGMAVLSIPYAGMVSVLVGFTALIPVFGAFIGTAIGAFLILMVSPVKALWFIIFIIVLQQLEGDIIYPRVVGKSIGLPSIWVMLAVIVGGSVGGAIGMLVGVPLCSIAYCVLKQEVNIRIKKKQVKQ